MLIWYQFLVTLSFLMIIKLKDVLQECLIYTFWNLNRQIEHKRSAKVSSSLHQVARAEMVVFVWTCIHTTER